LLEIGGHALIAKTGRYGQRGREVRDAPSLKWTPDLGPRVKV
jgi:hypothetical protein